MNTLPQLRELLLKVHNSDNPDRVTHARAIVAEIDRIKAYMNNDSQVASAADDMTGGQRFMAGAGKAFVDLGRGTEQLFREMTPGVSDRETELRKLSSEKRELDAPLIETDSGMAGNLVGNVAAMLPTSFIPGVNTAVGATAVGAGLGSLAPLEKDQSRLLNATVSALAGLGGHGLGKLVGRSVKPVQSKLGVEETKMAQVASREGVPLSVGERTGSRPLQWIESVMNDLPMTGSKAEAFRETQKNAFNKAVLSRSGINAEKATPEVLTNQKEALGEIFNRISKNNSLEITDDVLDDLIESTRTAGSTLTDGDSKLVKNMIDEIIGKTDKFGILSGEQYKAYRGLLRKASSGNDNLSRVFGELKRSLDKNFSKQLPKADSEIWKSASKKYQSLKIILDTVGGSAGDLGNISPTQLATVLRKNENVGREGYAMSKNELVEIAKMGKTFLGELPQSGTAPRKFYTDLLSNPARLATGGAVFGSSAGALNEEDRAGGAFKGGVIGAGLGIGGSLMTPKIVQALMNSKIGQKYLTNQIPIDGKSSKALIQALRLSSTGAVPGYSVQ